MREVSAKVLRASELKGGRRRDQQIGGYLHWARTGAQRKPASICFSEPNDVFVPGVVVGSPASLSSQIEYKNLSVIERLYLQRVFISDGRAIARAQRRPIKGHAAARHLCPDFAIRLEGKS